MSWSPEHRSSISLFIGSQALTYNELFPSDLLLLFEGVKASLTRLVVLLLLRALLRVEPLTCLLNPNSALSAMVWPGLLALPRPFLSDAHQRLIDS